MMTWGIFSRCDICAANVKIASLSNHQQRLIVKLYQILDEHRYINNKSFLSLTVPQQICECCVLKIDWLLNNLCKNIFQYSNGNMQTNPHLPKQGKDTNEIPKEQPHEYNCDCQECQTKFGSLPLLVQVIEGQEKSSQQPSGSTSLTSSSANIPIEQRSTSLSEPSTSYASISSSKKTMMCTHCNKNFTHRGDLNKHLRKHTGEQPYTCHVCKRKFAHTSNLNRHLKVHTGDRPFLCSVCNKNFSRKDKLEMHKKTKLCKKFSENM